MRRIFRAWLCATLAWLALGQLFHARAATDLSIFSIGLGDLSDGTPSTANTVTISGPDFLPNNSVPGSFSSLFSTNISPSVENQNTGSISVTNRGTTVSTPVHDNSGFAAAITTNSGALSILPTWLNSGTVVTESLPANPSVVMGFDAVVPGIVSNTGTFNVPQAWTNVSSILGSGTISAPTLINAGTLFANSLTSVLHLTASQMLNTGTMGADHGLLVVDGIFTNAGTVTFLHSAGTFNSAVVNQGAWRSDPTTLTFGGDDTIESNAYLQMAAGDVDSFQSNFFNFSHRSNDFDTTQGQFTFDGDGTRTQVFSVAGLDLGNTAAGYSNNFALGTLEIGNSNMVSTLELVDSFGLFQESDTNVAGLYVDTLTLHPGSLLILSNNVALFYKHVSGVTGIGVGALGVGDNVLLLNGSSFGSLSVVPEPHALALFAIGGWGIYLRARRRRPHAS